MVHEDSHPLTVTFLGTGGHAPTYDRHPTAIYLNYADSTYLLDAPPGIATQLTTHSETSPTVDGVFLTTGDASRAAGIAGLLSLLETSDYSDSLSIYVPAAERDRLASRLATYQFDVGLQFIGVAPQTAALTTDAYTITPFQTTYTEASVGYKLEEEPRRGRFDRELAESLGVEPGPKFGQLCNGESVEAADGTMVYPEQVLDDMRPGRHLVYTGFTGQSDTVHSAAKYAEVLIHDAPMPTGNRAQRGTGELAGQVACEANAKCLALVGVAPSQTPHTDDIYIAAERKCESQIALPDDGTTITIPYPDEFDEDIAVTDSSIR